MKKNPKVWKVKKNKIKFKKKSRMLQNNLNDNKKNEKVPQKSKLTKKIHQKKIKIQRMWQYLTKFQKLKKKKRFLKKSGNLE